MTEVERIVTRAKRGRAVFVGVIVLLCLVGVAYAVVASFEQDSRITRVERFSCVKNPAGEPCQKVKRESDRNRSLADTCIAFWKAGYPCPKPGTGRSIQDARGGDAPQPASAGQPSVPAPAGGNGGSKPPKSGDGGGSEPQGPGSSEPPAPPNSGSGPAPAPPSSSPAPPVASPEPSPPTPIRDAVKGLVEKACSATDHLLHLC